MSVDPRTQDAVRSTTTIVLLSRPISIPDLGPILAGEGFTCRLHVNWQQETENLRPPEVSEAKPTGRIANHKVP